MITAHCLDGEQKVNLHILKYVSELFEEIYNEFGDKEVHSIKVPFEVKMFNFLDKCIQHRLTSFLQNYSIIVPDNYKGPFYCFQRYIRLKSSYITFDKFLLNNKVLLGNSDQFNDVLIHTPKELFKSHKTELYDILTKTLDQVIIYSILVNIINKDLDIHTFFTGAPFSVVLSHGFYIAHIYCNRGHV